MLLNKKHLILFVLLLFLSPNYRLFALPGESSNEVILQEMGILKKTLEPSQTREICVGDSTASPLVPLIQLQSQSSTAIKNMNCNNQGEKVEEFCNCLKNNGYQELTEEEYQNISEWFVKVPTREYKLKEIGVSFLNLLSLKFWPHVSEAINKMPNYSCKDIDTLMKKIEPSCPVKQRNMIISAFKLLPSKIPLYMNLYVEMEEMSKAKGSDTTYFDGIEGKIGENANLSFKMHRETEEQFLNALNCYYRMEVLLMPTVDPKCATEEYINQMKESCDRNPLLASTNSLLKSKQKVVFKKGDYNNDDFQKRMIGNRFIEYIESTGAAILMDKKTDEALHLKIFDKMISKNAGHVIEGNCKRIEEELVNACEIFSKKYFGFKRDKDNNLVNESLVGLKNLYLEKLDMKRPIHERNIPNLLNEMNNIDRFFCYNYARFEKEKDKSDFIKEEQLAKVFKKNKNKFKKNKSNIQGQDKDQEMNKDEDDQDMDASEFSGEGLSERLKKYYKLDDKNVQKTLKEMGENGLEKISHKKIKELSSSSTSSEDRENEASKTEKLSQQSSSDQGSHNIEYKTDGTSTERIRQSGNAIAKDVKNVGSITNPDHSSSLPSSSSHSVTNTDSQASSTSSNGPSPEERRSLEDTTSKDKDSKNSDGREKDRLKDDQDRNDITTDDIESDSKAPSSKKIKNKKKKIIRDENEDMEEEEESDFSKGAPKRKQIGARDRNVNRTRYQDDNINNDGFSSTTGVETTSTQGSLDKKDSKRSESKTSTVVIPSDQSDSDAIQPKSKDKNNDQLKDKKDKSSQSSSIQSTSSDISIYLEEENVFTIKGKKIIDEEINILKKRFSDPQELLIELRKKRNFKGINEDGTYTVKKDDDYITFIIIGSKSYPYKGSKKINNNNKGSKKSKKTYKVLRSQLDDARKN